MKIFVNQDRSVRTVPNDVTRVEKVIGQIGGADDLVQVDLSAIMNPPPEICRYRVTGRSGTSTFLW
jgi:hypothetical protein